MADFASFHRYVLPFVGAGVLLPAVEDALRDAAIEFCERTRVAATDYTGINIVGNDATVDLSPLTAAQQVEICEPLEVWTTERYLVPKTETELNGLYWPEWRKEKVESLNGVRWWMATKVDEVLLVPYLTVNASAALAVRAAVRPIKAATSLPDALYSNWAEAIAAGALKRLHSHEAGYARPQRIIEFASKFEAAVVSAADHYAHGFGKPQLRTGLDEFS